jgi:hypothetical protein
MHCFQRTLGASLVALTLLLVSACTTAPDMEKIVTIAGGQDVHLPFAKGAPIMTETDDFRITLTQFLPGGGGKLLFLFAFHELRPHPLKRVLVEDVTDDKIFVMVDDQKPTVDAKGIWANGSKAFALSDEELSWLSFESLSVRVFRFTIETKDGMKVSLLQHTGFIQPFLKENMRRALKEQAEKGTAAPAPSQVPGVEPAASK